MTEEINKVSEPTFWEQALGVLAIILMVSGYLFFAILRMFINIISDIGIWLNDQISENRNRDNKW